MNIRVIAVTVLLCGALPAFAAKPTPPATPIHTTLPAEIILTQHEIAVEVPDTANAVGMQFGLIGALVGTAVSNAQVKNAEERVRGLRDTLLEYPFNARVEETLRRKLDAHAILAGQGLTTLDATWNGDSATMTNPVEDAVVLTPGYAVLSNFEQLSVKLSLSHVQRTARPGKKPKQKILFVRQYAFNFPLEPLEGHGADETAARWVSMGRPTLEALLHTGIEQVTDMMMYDLSAEGRVEAEQPIRGLSGMVGNQEFSGRVVREGDRWLWVRSGPGALRTLVGHHPLDEQLVAAIRAPNSQAGTTAADASGLAAPDPASGQGGVSVDPATSEPVEGSSAAPDAIPAPAPASGTVPQQGLEAIDQAAASGE